MAPEILLPSTGESFEFDGMAEIRGFGTGVLRVGDRLHLDGFGGYFLLHHPAGYYLLSYLFRGSNRIFLSPFLKSYSHDNVHFITTIGTAAWPFGR